eukprot:Lithocolla_globosa_v1_NODE_2095_length_2172_cov_26.194615.p3 type:complete len:105 gc:universal NODE_2095_length_2172_cov_26.194615:1971-1657(-)
MMDRSAGSVDLRPLKTSVCFGVEISSRNFFMRSMLFWMNGFITARYPSLCPNSCRFARLCTVFATRVIVRDESLSSSSCQRPKRKGVKVAATKKRRKMKLEMHV